MVQTRFNAFNPLEIATESEVTSYRLSFVQ